MFDKKRIVVSVLLAVMMICSPFVWVSNFSSNAIANEEVTRFICLSRQDCDKVLLSWEPVPFTKSYEVRRSDTLVKELTQDFTMYIDSDIQNKQTYNYSIIAKDIDGKIISTSFSIPVLINCPDENDKTTLEFQVNSFMYRINGIQKGPMSTEPVVMSGRSFLVIRYIAEELSAKISWDGSEKKVTITTRDGKIIELWIGKPNAKIDGEDVFIDEDDHSIVPYISEGRTLLPLRFVSNSLGAEEVLWDGETKTITLIWVNDNSTKHQIQLIVNEKSNETNKVSAYDVLGNNYVFDLVQENISLESGDQIVTNYTISKVIKTFESAVAFIAPENTSKIDMSELIKGVVIANIIDKKLCTITISSDKQELTFTYDIGLDGLTNVEPDSWIRISSTENKHITSWEYLRNELHEGVEEFSAEFFNDNQHISMNSLGINTENTVSDNPFPSVVTSTNQEFESLSVDTCYRLAYSTNWLGRNILTSIEETVCPCDLSIISLSESEVSIYSGEKFEYSFQVTNNSLVNKEISLFANCDSGEFPGKFELLCEEIRLDPKESKKVVLLIKPDDKVSQDFKITYGAVCDGQKIEQEFALEVIFYEADYEIIMQEYIHNPNNHRIFSVPVTIKNIKNSSMDLSLSVTKKAGMTVEISSENVNLLANSSKQVFININLGKDNYYKKGESFLIVLTVDDNLKKKKFSCEYLTDSTKRPVVDISTSFDKKTNTVTLDADIDWLMFKPDHVTVDWGDGKAIKSAGSFPYKHKYSKNGTYVIKVTAYTTKSIWNLHCLGWGYETIIVGSMNKYPELNNLSIEVDEDVPTRIKLSCDIDWKQYSSEKIGLRILWGDGKYYVYLKDGEPLLIDSEIEYNYQEFIRKRSDKHYIIQLMFVSKAKKKEDIKVLKTYRLEVDIKGSKSK